MMTTRTSDTQTQTGSQDTQPAGCHTPGVGVSRWVAGHHTTPRKWSEPVSHRVPAPSQIGGLFPTLGSTRFSGGNKKESFLWEVRTSCSWWKAVPPRDRLRGQGGEAAPQRRSIRCTPVQHSAAWWAACWCCARCLRGGFGAVLPAAASGARHARRRAWPGRSHRALESRVGTGVDALEARS